jgi:signal transduction histidine kinase
MANISWPMLGGLLAILVLAIAALAFWRWRAFLAKDRKKELAAAVTQRTQELALKADRAEEANRLKSQFLTSISHEIRTPLTGILGTLELALMTELTQEQLEYIELSKTSAQSLLALLDDLQDFSKIESERIEIDHVEFSIGHAVRGAVTTITPRAEEKGLVLGAKIAPDLPDRVMGDPDRLRQVLLRILDHIVKLSSGGSASVDVSLNTRRTDEKLPDHSLQVLFSVQINDPRIRKHAEDLNFQSFRPLDGSAVRKPGELGAGLAMCGRLVRLMGGRLWVDGEVKAGSRFCFTAQFELPEKSTVKTPQAPTTDAGRKDWIKGVRVLVAEDNRINQVVTLRMLEKHGFQVLVAKNGREALEMLQWETVDLILMDVQMPEMDGLEATRRIRELERKTGAHVPILAMTANALQGDRDKCLGAGMDGYLTKPVQSNQLYQAIEDVLAK